MQPKIKNLLADKKFIAIVGMLGSDGHGERANAAALAGKMLKEAGTTWAELLTASEGSGGAEGYFTKEGELRLTANRLATAQRALEASETALKEQKKTVANLRKELKTAVTENIQLKQTIAEAQEMLKGMKRTVELLKAQKKGWTPFEEEKNSEAEWVKPAPQAHLSWLHEVISRHQSKLTDWEENFLIDFEGKSIVSKKQYDILKRIAEKVRVPPDF